MLPGTVVPIVVAVVVVITGVLGFLLDRTG
jgi:hypothetical protein